MGRAFRVSSSFAWHDSITSSRFAQRTIRVYITTQSFWLRFRFNFESIFLRFWAGSAKFPERLIESRSKTQFVYQKQVKLLKKVSRSKSFFMSCDFFSQTFSKTARVQKVWGVSESAITFSKNKTYDALSAVCEAWTNNKTSKKSLSSLQFWKKLFSSIFKKFWK